MHTIGREVHDHAHRIFFPDDDVSKQIQDGFRNRGHLQQLESALGKEVLRRIDHRTLGAHEQDLILFDAKLFFGLEDIVRPDHLRHAGWSELLRLPLHDEMHLARG